MLGLGPSGNCDCFPVSALVRKGTAERPRAGAQLGTPTGPEGRETPLAQAWAQSAVCTACVGTGRLREPNHGYGAARPPCSSARNWEQQGQLLHLGQLQAVARGTLAPHGAGRTRVPGHSPV